MSTILHPYLDVETTVQNKVLDLYATTFPGAAEMRVDQLPSREVYVIFCNGEFASFVIFNGPILAYLAVMPTDRGKGRRYGFACRHE